MKNVKIFPAITTLKGSDWREKINEINQLKLSEIALFLTCVDAKTRRALYQCLKKSTIKQIPFVHLRSDMELWELDYLIQNYRTQIFNAHSQTEFPFKYDLSKYQKMIFIENTYTAYNAKEIKQWGGACLDFSHLENDRILRPEIYKQNIAVLKKYPPGCNHVASIKKQARVNLAVSDQRRYDDHHLENLTQLDYLTRFPREFFSPFMAIELINSIKEQLSVKKYLTTLPLSFNG